MRKKILFVIAVNDDEVVNDGKKGGPIITAFTKRNTNLVYRQQYTAHAMLKKYIRYYTMFLEDINEVKVNILVIFYGRTFFSLYRVYVFISLFIDLLI